MKWPLRLGAVAIMTLAVTAPVYAHGYRGFEGDSGGVGGFPFLLRGLGLTEDQQAQVRQIVANHRPEFRRLAGEIRSAREALSAKLYASNPVGPADLAPLTEQIARLQGQLSQQRLQVALEIRGVLTPEQLAKAAQTRQRLIELRKEMRGLLPENR